MSLQPVDLLDDGADEIDPGLQARWCAAALRSFAARPWIKGAYWWQWSTDPSVGGLRDTSYTPYHKPCAQVLRRWFGRIKSL